MDHTTSGKVHQPGKETWDQTYTTQIHSQILPHLRRTPSMKIAVIIPAHNEEQYLPLTLDSLLSQDRQPDKIVVVDDNSTDRTSSIIREYSNRFDKVNGVFHKSSVQSEPGSKVVHAFNVGLDSLEDNYDVICKLDADLIFPSNYLYEVERCFQTNPRCGMTGGFCYIEQEGKWVLESLTDADHIRGALKAYRRECFEAIGRLRPAMGWDTVDELLARYHGWTVITLEGLKVKHLKPTGSTYKKGLGKRQGKAFRSMRYGFTLSSIGLIKLAWKKGSLRYLMDGLVGYLSPCDHYLLSKDEGSYLRKWRHDKIKKRLFPASAS